MSCYIITAVNYLEWITLSNSVVLPESDDGTTGPVNIPTPGFPFWDSVQTDIYVRILNYCIT